MELCWSSGRVLVPVGLQRTCGGIPAKSELASVLVSHVRGSPLPFGRRKQQVGGELLLSLDQSARAAGIKVLGAAPVPPSLRLQGGCPGQVSDRGRAAPQRCFFATRMTHRPCSPQVQFLSPRARRRFHAALASCSTSMLILSNLVFLGSSQVGKIYWNRIFIQGKLPSSAIFSQLLFHVCSWYLEWI